MNTFRVIFQSSFLVLQSSYLLTKHLFYRPNLKGWFFLYNETMPLIITQLIQTDSIPLTLLFSIACCFVIVSSLICNCLFLKNVSFITKFFFWFGAINQESHVCFGQIFAINHLRDFWKKDFKTFKMTPGQVIPNHRPIQVMSSTNYNLIRKESICTSSNKPNSGMLSPNYLVK